jgi:hypothetical protein
MQQHQHRGAGPAGAVPSSRAPHSCKLPECRLTYTTATWQQLRSGIPANVVSVLLAGVCVGLCVTLKQ